MAEVVPQPEVISQLAALFRRNGYVRRQKTDRLVDDGYRKYKKGDEVRLTAVSVEELELIRQLLSAAGFDPGRAFAKAQQWNLPIYGRSEVARFLTLIGENSEATPASPTKKAVKKPAITLTPQAYLDSLTHWQKPLVLQLRTDV
ncbi:MAG: hypothetical protein ACRCZF_14770, partial [Gemmataceae bacterium]